MTSYRAFAVCLPGLAPLLANELQELKLDPEPEGGGVAFEGGLDDLYRVNLHSGIANHVLVRVAEFGARSLADLDHRGARTDWCRWLPPGTPFTVKASCRRSRIYHSGAAEDRIRKHLVAQLGVPESTGEDVIVRVRIEANRCQISLDTSGEPLHRRGWRLQPSKAPLREDLAHALLLASDWDRRNPILDPMMGSGTILIEAACLARGLAPGRLRTFAIEDFAIHDGNLLENLRTAAKQGGSAGSGVPLFGSDRDERALEAARANAERAGVFGDLEIRSSELSRSLEGIELTPAGRLITNPPYGQRLGNKDALANLYRGLGRLAGQLPEEWQVMLAASDRRLALRSGLKLETAFLADHGGSKIRALHGPARI